MRHATQNDVNTHLTSTISKNTIVQLDELFTTHLHYRFFPTRRSEDRKDRLRAAGFALAKYTSTLPYLPTSITLYASVANFVANTTMGGGGGDLHGSCEEQRQETCVDVWALAMVRFLFQEWMFTINAEAEDGELPFLKWAENIEDDECEEDEVHFLTIARLWVRSCWESRECRPKGEPSA